MPVSASVRNLAKRYGGLEAVRGVSFDVHAGEIFGLLGPNGAGKTTTLECILGLRRPDSGSVTIAGIDAIARPEEARRMCGAQIQAAMLQDKVTPRRALRLFGSFYRSPAGAGALLSRFGLVEKADAPFESLSGGQRQRLFLALAFVNNPGFVVLDEPTSGLDPRARRDLRLLITEMRGSGCAVLMSTHDLDEAELLCDRIGIIDLGRQVACGRPRDLVAASGLPSSIRVKTSRPLDRSHAELVPCVSGVRLEGDLSVFTTSDVSQTVMGIARVLGGAGIGIVEIRTSGPSLEDVFLSLTGRGWSKSSDPDR